MGSWGHRFAGKDGRLVGYGMMNAPDMPLTISLELTRLAGVTDKEIPDDIERSAKLLRFYIGKGAVPYGDNHPWIKMHDDNGKCGMAAVLFNLLKEEEVYSSIAQAVRDAQGRRHVVANQRGDCTRGDWRARQTRRHRTAGNAHSRTRPQRPAGHGTALPLLRLIQ